MNAAFPILLNPVGRKEIRGRMRSPAAFLVLGGYLLAFCGLILLVWLASLPASSAGNMVQANRILGKTLLGLLFGLQIMATALIAPALTAGGITGELERRTFDLLRITHLTGLDLILGKLHAAMVFLLLLVAVSLPLMQTSTFFGGVGFAEIAIGLVLVLATTFAFSAVGIFFSSFTRRTLVSMLLAYTVIPLVLFGIPAFLAMTGGIFGALYSAPGGLSGPAEKALAGLAYLLIMLNPFTTAATSALILSETNSPWYYWLQLSVGRVPVLAPWLGYAFLCLAAGLLLILASAWLVSRKSGS